MHAPSDSGSRFLKKRSVLALLTVLTVAGCGASSHSDNGALGGVSAPPSTAVAAAAGPVVTIVSGEPDVVGNAGATKALHSPSAGCAPTVERDDAEVLSVLWRCADTSSGVTYDLATGRVLSLSDLLTGSYTSYLTGLADTQFQEDGLPKADTSSITTWYLTPLSLVAVYPAGPIDYPIASLTAHLKQPSPLR